MANPFRRRRTAFFIANGFAVATVVGASFVGLSGDATPVLTAPLAVEAQTLEAETAKAPTSENVAALANVYLDRKEPGLALALLDRHNTLESPETSLARGRALYADGQARAALSVLDDLSIACEETRATNPCPSWVVTKTLHERAFFSEMVAAGIDDAAKDPIGAQAAFERSRREVRLVAIR